MSAHPLAAPMVVLLAWTMVMFFWMYATRIPAMLHSDIDLKTLRGTTGRSLDEALPPSVQWKAHNYNHLMEQPTIFYAIVLALAIMGFDASTNVVLAWSYVGLRVVHSIVQATVNIVAVRLTFFMLATLCLLGLTLHAAMALLH